MQKIFFKKNKIVEHSLFLAIFLIYLDSYQIFQIPFSWIGSSILLLIAFFLYFNEKISFSLAIFIIYLIATIPTLVNIFYSEYDIRYLVLRIFSFSSFTFILYVLVKTSESKLILKSLKKVYYSVFIISIYTYFAQIFNLYEPQRNRPGTGILGFDVQTNFWIYSSHRMVGTFREPIFLVSILFPAFLVLHYNQKNSNIFYIISGVLFGLTKSELVLIFIIGTFVLDLILKETTIKNLYFVSIFFIAFSVSLIECELSPKNFECPQQESNQNQIINSGQDAADEIPDKNDSNINISNIIPENNLNNIEFQDRERSDILEFTYNYLPENIGFGFQNTNRIYTESLATPVLNEQYLVNRTQPKYLRSKYLSKSLGTGRYFLTYENVNLQNNFIFNLFSIGMSYAVFLFLVLIYCFNKSLEFGLKIAIILFVISLSSMEDLLPIFGLYLGLMFTMDRDENK